MSEPTQEQVDATVTPEQLALKAAVLAGTKKGAKSDAEAVRNFRESQRTIEAALPALEEYFRVAVAEKARAEVFTSLIPVLEDAVSNAYLRRSDRGIGNEWDEVIARAEAALEQAEAYRKTKEGER